MQLSELSNIRPIGGGASVEWLYRTIEALIGEAAGFSHFEPIMGEAYSARVLSTFEFPTAAKLPRIMSGRDVAEELVRLAPDSRYQPESFAGAAKGWVISSAVLGGKQVMLAQTMYCGGWGAV